MDAIEPQSFITTMSLRAENIIAEVETQYGIKIDNTFTSDALCRNDTCIHAECDCWGEFEKDYIAQAAKQMRQLRLQWNDEREDNGLDVPFHEYVKVRADREALTALVATRDNLVQYLIDGVDTTAQIEAVSRQIDALTAPKECTHFFVAGRCIACPETLIDAVKETTARLAA